MKKGSQGTLFIDVGNVGHCLGVCSGLNYPVFRLKQHSRILAFLHDYKSISYLDLSWKTCWGKSTTSRCVFKDLKLRSRFRSLKHDLEARQLSQRNIGA